MDLTQWTVYMNNFIKQSIGGLSKQYYIRDFLFGMLFFGFFVWVISTSTTPMKFPPLFIFAISTLLYPYSRFVYETLINYIIGDNRFWTNAILFLMTKFIMMALCWAFAIFIAPIGLIGLYFYHSYQERNQG